MWLNTQHNNSSIGDIAPLLSSAQLGYVGELWVTNKLRALLPAHLIVTHLFRNGCDVIVWNNVTNEYIRIEVKTARAGLDGKYRATLEKEFSTSAHLHADIVVFLCVENNGDVTPFVINYAEIVGRRHLVVTSNPRTYVGRTNIGQTLNLARNNWYALVDRT